MPSLLHYLGLFLFALLPLASLGLYTGDTDSSGTSGSELLNEAHAPDHSWVYIAKHMRHDVTRVLDEQFKRDFAGTRNLTVHVSIETPLLGHSDGCLPPDFIAHKCLRKIYSGLQEYDVYLRYVERENLNKVHMMNIKTRISRLLRLIKETGSMNDDKVHPTAFKLPEDSAWTRKTITRSILSNFADFMTDAIRAVTYMKPKKSMKSTLKDEEWFLKHEQ